MSAQLALNVGLKDTASFANFLSAQNAEAVNCLSHAVEALAAGRGEERVVFLWGPAASGRTHLLHAACLHAQDRRLAFVYIPFHEVDTRSAGMPPTLLDGIESAPLICLDNVQIIAGRRPWEEAVFALAERVRATAGLLVAVAGSPPAEIGLSLPDLATRLAWGPVFALHALTDDEKLAALQLRATRLGLELPPEVARYVLARYPRDMNSLFAWLDRMDKQSLVSQRRLTIPFVRELEKG